MLKILTVTFKMTISMSKSKMKGPERSAVSQHLAPRLEHKGHHLQQQSRANTPPPFKPGHAKASFDRLSTKNSPSFYMSAAS